MADFVVQTTVRLDDQVSAGAQAAATALNKLADASDKATKSTDDLSQTTQRVGPSYEAVNRRIDENAKLTGSLDAINRKYTLSLAAVRAEHDAGSISAEKLVESERRLSVERDTAIGKANDGAARMKAAFDTQKGSLDQVTTSSGNAAFAQRQFSVQSIQLFSSIASGQPILTSFIQQGHQMVDVALSTGTGFGVVGDAIKGAMGAVLSPIGLTVAALAAMSAIVYEVASHANEMETETRTLQTAISGVGRSASVSASQLQEYATQLAHTSELSKADATAQVAAIIRTPGITQANAQSIVSSAPNVASALGTTTPEAVKQLTDAYTGNYAAIQKLMAASNDFNLAQVTQVRNFLEQGDKASALKLIIDQLGKSMDGSRTNSLSPMDAAFKELSNGWDDFVGRVAKSEPVISIMERFRQATLGWADLLKNDTGAVSREIVDLTNQGLRLQETLKAETDRGIVDPDTEKKIADINAQIDSLIEKSRKLSESLPDAANGGKPRVYDQPPIPEALVPPTTEQSQTRDRMIKSYEDQNQVLSASLPIRAAVTAAQQVDNAVLAGSLSAKDAAVVKEQAMAAAMKQAGDAAVQEAASQDRATGYAIKMTDAIHQSSVAALQAAAATEAHEKAVTQAGVSEAAYVEIILNRNAAQAVQAGAQQTSDLKEQLELSTNVVNAIGDQGRHEADLRNAVLASTKAMVDKAAASQNPGMIAAAKTEVDAQIKIGHLIDDNANKRKSNETIDAATREADAQTRIAQAYDGTALSITKATNAETARSTLIRGSVEDQAKLTAELNRGSKASADFQQAQASVAAVSNVLGNAMDQLGQGIVDAFTSGSGSAVNFGNIMKSVITSIISQIAKLAIINPIINSVLGQSLPTAQLAFSSLAGGGGGNTTSSSTPTFSLNSAGQLVSTGNSVYNAATSQGLFSLSSLTSTTNGGFAPLFSGGTSTMATGYGSGVLNTPVFGGTSESGSIMNAYGGTEGLSSIQPASGLTYGGALQGAGGILMGYSVGSTVGGFLAGDSPQKQTTSKIGSAIGSIAGAYFGPLGSVVGGTLGGIIGGLFGPGKKNMYSSQAISVNDKGQFEIGNMISQVDPNAAAEEAAAQSDTATMNKYLSDNNVKAVSTGQIWQLGDNTPGGFMDPTKAQDFAAGFSNYRFAAANDNKNPEINSALSKVLDDKSFATIDDFDKAVAGVHTFLETTVPELLKVGKTSGSLNDNIKTVNDTFKDAITQAHDLGVEEDNLTKTRDDAIKALNDEAAKNLAITGKQLTGSYNSALASLTNDTKLAQQNSLDAFDMSADAQRDTLMNNLVNTYGDAYKETATYADLMAKLEKSLGEQRLVLLKSFDQQAVSSVTSTITSLSSYAASLKYGAASPLDTVDQYNQALSKFNAVSGAAKAGDYNSIASLQNYANALLSLSRDMYGSGTGYVSDYNKVIDVIDSLSALTSDSLTASFYAAQTAAQTDSIVSALSDLKTEVTAVKLAITQSTSAPSRIANAA